MSRFQHRASSGAKKVYMTVEKCFLNHCCCFNLEWTPQRADLLLFLSPNK